MFIPQVAVVNSHYGLKLNWTPSTAPDFSHYSIHMSQESGRNHVHLGDTPNPSFTILETLAGGTYYFLIYVHDENGNRSVASEEFQINIT